MTPTLNPGSSLLETHHTGLFMHSMVVKQGILSHCDPIQRGKKTPHGLLPPPHTPFAEMKHGTAFLQGPSDEAGEMTQQGPEFVFPGPT